MRLLYVTASLHASCSCDADEDILRLFNLSGSNARDMCVLAADRRQSTAVVPAAQPAVDPAVQAKLPGCSRASFVPQPVLTKRAPQTQAGNPQPSALPAAAANSRWISHLAATPAQSASAEAVGEVIFAVPDSNEITMPEVRADGDGAANHVAAQTACTDGKWAQSLGQEPLAKRQRFMAPAIVQTARKAPPCLKAPPTLQLPGAGLEQQTRLRFPAPGTALPKARACTIENTFQSEAQYASACASSIEEELNLRFATRQHLGRCFQGYECDVFHVDFQCKWSSWRGPKWMGLSADCAWDWLLAGSGSSRAGPMAFCSSARLARGPCQRTSRLPCAGREYPTTAAASSITILPGRVRASPRPTTSL